MVKYQEACPKIYCHAYNLLQMCKDQKEILKKVSTFVYFNCLLEEVLEPLRWLMFSLFNTYFTVYLIVDFTIVILL